MPEPDEPDADPRRPAAADLHLLPPGARPGGADRADAAAGLRRGDRRHRAGVPRRRGDDGRAPHPREEEDRGGAHPVRRARPRRAARAASTRCSPSSTCSTRPGTPRRRASALVRDDLTDRALDLARMLRAAAAGRPRGRRAAGAAARPPRPPRHAHRRDGRLLRLEEQDRVGLGPRADRRGRPARRRRARAPARRAASRCRRRSRRCTRRRRATTTTDWPQILDALRRAAARLAVAGRRAQPRGGGGDGRRAGGGAGGGRGARARRPPGRLPLPAGDEGRPAAPARPRRRGGRRPTAPRSRSPTTRPSRSSSPTA